MIKTSPARKSVRKQEHAKPPRVPVPSRKSQASALRSFQANAEFVREIIEESILPELWSAADQLTDLDFKVDVKVAGSGEVLADYHSHVVAWAEIHVRTPESDVALILRFDGRASNERWEVTPVLHRSEHLRGWTKHLSAAWEMLARFIRERLTPFLSATA